MFYEYAITPEVFDAAFLTGNVAIPVILTELLRGICENGMISDLHKSGWSRDIARRMDGMPSPKAKTNLMALLSVLKDRNRLVRHPKGATNPNSDLEWLELAREANSRAPLDAIMLTPGLLIRSGINDDVFVEINSVLDLSVWLGRRRSNTIKQREEDYRSLLPKILRHAKRLYLIDPYFRPDRRQWTDTIRICASLMGQRGGEPLHGIIEIHTGDPSNRTLPRDPREELADWERWKRNEFAQNLHHSLLITMWRRFDDGERVHDRFLITDQVGFSIAGGLDCVRPAFGTTSDTIWTLMDEQDRQHWLSKFRVDTSPYERIEC